MNILFVDPLGDEESKGLNMGIAYCAANLRKHNHKVSVLDPNNIRPGDPRDRLKKAVETFKPHAIGFSVMNLSYHNALTLADNLRRYYKGLIIFGGAEVSAQKENLFKHSTHVDIACIGEGENTLVEIANSFDNNEFNNKLSSIKGIIWKNDNGVVTNAPRELEKNLDVFPFPDYEVFGVHEMTQYSFMTSRGCPYNCIFCFSYLGRSWRARNIGACIKEMKWAIERYKVKVFQICDPSFNINIKRVNDFCDALIQENIDLPWYVMGIRADKITDEMADKMRKSGCRRAYIGIESLDEYVFSQIDKGETIEQIKNGIKIFKNKDIEVYGFLIIGLPGDTLKRTLYSYEEAQKLDLDALAFASAVPFTGTRLEKWIQDGNAKPIANSHEISSLGTKYENIAYESRDFTLGERKKARLLINIKAGTYNEPRLPKWLFNLKKIYLIIRYDYKNLFRRIKKSIKYRKNIKKSLDSVILSRYIIFGKSPDGTWGLAKDEKFLPSTQPLKINLKSLD